MYTYYLLYTELFHLEKLENLRVLLIINLTNIFLHIIKIKNLIYIGTKLGKFIKGYILVYIKKKCGKSYFLAIKCI